MNHNTQSFTDKEGTDLVKIEVDLLSAELDRLSTESQTFSGLIASFVGSLLVSIGALVALVARETEQKPVDDWQWGSVALVPLLISSYSVVQIARTVLRSAYARRTERAIAQLLNKEYGAIDEVDGYPATPFFETVTVQLESLKRGDTALRKLMITMWIAVATTLLGICLFVLARMDSVLSIVLFSMVYLSTIIPMTTLISRTIAKTALTKRVMQGALQEINGNAESAKTKSNRSLLSYILIPRPNDFVIKALGLHATSTGFGIAVSLNQESSAKALSAGLTVLLCFEFLMYQARYMVNDWAGKASDDSHPARSLRGRIPIMKKEILGERRYAIRASLIWTGIVLKIGLGLGLPFFMLDKRSESLGLFACSLGIWILALVYEWLRKRTADGARIASQSRAVFACVGVSYGLRAALGLWFGSQGQASALFISVIFIAFYLMGVAIVMMGWVLEATSFILATDDLPALVDTRLSAKAHIVYLGRLACLFRDASDLDRATRNSAEATRFNETPLKNRSVVPQPWDRAIVGAIGVAMVLGPAVARGVPFDISALDLFAFPFGIVVGLVTVGWPVELQKHFEILLVGLSLAALVVIQFPSERWMSFWAPIPTIAVLATYHSTRMMSYEKAQSLPSLLAALPRRLAIGVSEVTRELFAK